MEMKILYRYIHTHTDRQAHTERERHTHTQRETHTHSLYYVPPVSPYLFFCSPRTCLLFSPSPLFSLSLSHLPLFFVSHMSCLRMAPLWEGRLLNPNVEGETREPQRSIAKINHTGNNRLQQIVQHVRNTSDGLLNEGKQTSKQRSEDLLWFIRAWIIAEPIAKLCERLFV